MCNFCWYIKICLTSLGYFIFFFLKNELVEQHNIASKFFELADELTTNIIIITSQTDPGTVGFYFTSREKAVCIPFEAENFKAMCPKC